MEVGGSKPVHPDDLLETHSMWSVKFCTHLDCVSMARMIEREKGSVDFAGRRAL